MKTPFENPLAEDYVYHSLSPGSRFTGWATDKCARDDG